MKRGELIILWVGGLLSVALLIPAAPTAEPFVMVGSARAAQVDPERWVLNCTEWNGINNPEVVKLAYVHGYLQGIQAVADKFRKDEIIIDLWPIGHRVVSVAIELDVYCLRAENRNVSVWQLIQHMAREKNK